MLPTTICRRIVYALLASLAGLIGIANGADSDQHTLTAGNRRMTVREIKQERIPAKNAALTAQRDRNTFDQLMTLARTNRAIKPIPIPAQNPPMMGATSVQAVPIITLNDCQTEDLAAADGGFVITHYGFCQQAFYEVSITQCDGYDLPFIGCTGEEVKGVADFRVTVVGSGWDGDMFDPSDIIDQKYNQMRFVVFLDQWEFSGELAELMPTQGVRIEILCTPQNREACLQNPSEAGHGQTIAQWMVDGSMFYRMLSDPVDGTGPDLVTEYNFNYRLTFNQPTSDTIVNTTGNGFRCDSAFYLKGGRGCMFHRLVENFAKLSLASTSNNKESALHILDAMRLPGLQTVPPLDGKNVPGNLFAEDPHPLTRAVDRPGYDPTVIPNNRGVAVATCEQTWGTGYSKNPAVCKNLPCDCDEYPFATTFQGSALANPPNNYSVRLINLSDNRSAGAVLGNWLRQERMLRYDPFWVIIPTGTGGSGGGGGDEFIPFPIDLGNLPPVVHAGPDLLGDEGSSLMLLGSVADPEGDVVSATWSYKAGADVDPGATCAFTKSTSPTTRFSCTDDGTFTITLTATDGVNAPVSSHATVRLRNVAPTLHLVAPTAWKLFRVGTQVDLNATFTDPGTNDTHTCAVEWDDGLKETFPPVGNACTRSHIFRQAGMYTITTTVTDDDGGTGTEMTLAVVYDPDAGFVTGGGFINSPAGALTTNKDLTGVGHFQFNPKYHKGDTVPSGKANFQLDGGITFTSDNLEWLVVTPNNRFAVKGTGSVGGTGGYGFVLYGYNSPDRYRLVVWPLSDGAFPTAKPRLYDNRPLAPYDVDVADPQGIAGGSIQIHLQ